MKTSVYIIKSICSLAICLLLAGCQEKLGDGVSLEGIEIGEAALRINLGETAKAKAYPVPWDCTDYEFKWETANPEIATVDNYGKIMAVGIGNTVVSVSQGSLKKEFAIETYEITLREKLENIGVKGFWEFMDADNLFKATVGADLIPVGTGFEQIDGYNSRTKAAVIPCSTNDGFNHLIYNHGFAANGGGAKVNEYTVVIDCKFPGGGGPMGGATWTNGKYHSLFQTSKTNSDDADFFWRPGADWGITGCYTASKNLFVRDTWYRFVVCAKMGEEPRYYMNGARYPKNPTSNNPAVDSERAWELDGILFFADESLEDGQGFPLHVGALAAFDRAITEDEVKGLGVIPLL